MKKQTRQAANDQRIAFSKAMIHWLQSKEYQVGLTGADLDIDEGADLIRSLLPTAVTLLGLGQVGALITPFLSSESGSEADRIKAAVTPYVPLADVLGLHRSGDEMLAVIYGDSLSDEELLTRFDMFLEFGRPFTGLKSWSRVGCGGPTRPKAIARSMFS
jgi:hypothetical protein